MDEVLICTDYPITLKPFYINDECGEEEYYDKYGKFYMNYGEPILFPSKDHQTWDNWQEVLIPKCVGSVIVTTGCGYEWIVTNNGMFAMNMNMNEDKTHLWSFDEMCYDGFRFATPKEIEVFFERLNKLGYKFENGEVVKKEEKKWSLLDAKDGDFIYDKALEGIFIFKRLDKDRILRYASHIDDEVYVDPDAHYSIFEEGIERFRPATNYEEDLLLNNLFKAGYRWNADKKVIKVVGAKGNENLEKKFTINDFKPFDKVLVRLDGYKWSVDFYSYFDREINKYVATSDSSWEYCVPYNKETASLLGTTKEYNGKYKTWED